MADGGGGGKGKILAGCGCISLLFFSVMTTLFQVALMPIREAAPEAAPIIDTLIAYGTFFTGPCCCLSGVAFIIGVVLTVTGNKKSEG